MTKETTHRGLFPAARIGDPVTHDLASPAGMIGPPLKPPTDAPVLIEGLPAAHVECTAVCTGSTSAGLAHPPPGAGAPPVPLLVGSPTVMIHGRPAARWAPSGDLAGCGTFLGDPKLAPLRTVHIGGPVLPSSMPFARRDNGDIQLGRSITIIGDEQFKILVLNRLMKIASTSSGKTLLAQLEATGKHVSIAETAAENSYATPRSSRDATPAGRPVFDGEGKPVLDVHGDQRRGTGLGTDVTVELNPRYRTKNPLDPANPMPNDAVLFHELTHAKHDMLGTGDCTPKGNHWTTEEEYNTIRGDSPSEADYLREREYKWRRTSHHGDFEPVP
ncbi:MAG: M91 family zinc metallopeptidase [Polyangiales bacterium]